MRLPRAGLAVAAVCLIAASPAAAAISVTPAGARLDDTVTVKTVVPTGDNSYDPAYYVDWLAGACPATASAARTKAIGNTTRGLGVATIEGGGTDSVPVSAKVTLEQRSQRVCFYGGGGALADQATIAARVVIPALHFGEPPENPWFMQAVARVRIDGRIHEDPLGWAIIIYFNGRRPAKGLAHITCNRKRFDLIPSRIKLRADGSISYSGPVKADNSNNYDAPIPLKYPGRATFRFHASAFIGRAPLRNPITSLGGQVSGPSLRKLGEWGLPQYRVDARFSAPGFHPFAGKPGCGSRLKALMIPAIDSPVMAGQGEASLGQGGPGDAGKQHTFQNTPPSATWTTDGQYHSISQGTGTVHFSSQSVDNDDGIASEDWDFGDGSTGSGREVDHTYTAPGTYTVVLTVTDKHGLKDSYTGQAYIDP